MKTLFIFLLVLIAGCGTDTVNNPNTPPPYSSVVFSMDSVRLTSEFAGFNDSTISHTINVDLDSFKVSYTIGTNNDSNSYDYVSFNIVDSGSVILQNTEHWKPNGTSFSYYGFSSHGKIDKVVNVYLGIQVPSLLSGKYLTIKDFKIYR